MNFLDEFGSKLEEWVNSATAPIEGVVSATSTFVWGPFLLIPLLLGAGIILTSALGGIQFRRLGYGLWLAFFKRHEARDTEGDISHYQALSVALAATVGVGNIGGVAAAFTLGGPGALFWMWITGLLGMATKYSEALLGVKYRTVNEHGEQSGGPQQYLTRGLADITYLSEPVKKRIGAILGLSFAVFGVVASFGIGNALQSGNVSSAITGQWEGVDNSLVGIIMPRYLNRRSNAFPPDLRHVDQTSRYIPLPHAARSQR